MTQRHPVGVARGDPAFREVRGGVERFRHRALRWLGGVFGHYAVVALRQRNVDLPKACARCYERRAGHSKENRHADPRGDHSPGTRQVRGRGPRGRRPAAGEIQVKLVATGPLPLRRPRRHRRHPGRHLPVRGRPRGRGHRHKAAAPNTQGDQGGRPRRLLVPALLRALPLVRVGHAEPLRPRRRAARGLPVGRPDRLPAQARRRRTARSARCAASRRSSRPPRSRPTRR